MTAPFCGRCDAITEMAGEDRQGSMLMLALSASIAQNVLLPLLLRQRR